MKVQQREIKLGEMLERLIEDRGYARNRKKISTQLDISPAALSQYVRDQTRPSFSKLIALADFFGVSLDYLVYGKVAGGTQETDYEPTLRFVDFALSEVQARTSRHSAIVARIGRVLADQINDVAAELIGASTVIREGLVHDDEMLRIEKYCRQADIFSLNLAFDVIPAKGGVTAGRFLDVVAENLRKQVRYRFLIPDEDYVPDEIVANFRQLLARQVGGDQVHQYCAFRRTSEPVVTGAVLYQLDINEMRRHEAALHAQFISYFDKDGWFGCAMRPNTDSDSDMLLDPVHLRRATETFGKFWSSGEPL